MAARFLSENKPAVRIIRGIAIGLGLILLLTIPWITPSAYILHTIVTIIIYVPLVLSQNLITGFTGMLTMGQAAFYGLGAYTSALLVMKLDVPWPIAFLAAGAVAAIAGIIVGVPCLRVGSDYLTLMTIGFGVIFSATATNWVDLTRGSMGMPGVPPASIGSFVFNTLPKQYYLYLLIAAACYFFMYRLTRSHIGRALIAIREDEIAASTVGINLAYYKVLAFTFGALWAGFAGSMLAHMLAFVGPQSFTLDESLLHVQMAILGGFGSLTGSVIGAAILVSLPQIFQDIYKYRMLINGILLLMLMAWRPQGIMGKSAIAMTVAANPFTRLAGFIKKLRRPEKEGSSVSQQPPTKPQG
jgi:branched-chain amino acid transport system permease protein